MPESCAERICGISSREVVGAVRKMIEKDTLIKILDCCIEDDCNHCPNSCKDGSIAACEALARGSVVIPFSIMREVVMALKESTETIKVNQNGKYCANIKNVSNLTIN
jgi:hypothetical protein